MAPSKNMKDKPKRRVPVIGMVPESVKATLDKHAAKRDMSRSRLICVILQEWDNGDKS